MIYKTAMAALIILLFVLSVALSEWRDSVFQEKIDHAENEMREMARDHARAMDAAQKAMAAREAVLEREREKICRAQKTLGNNPDFCAMPLPDDVRLLFRENDENSALPAAGGSSGTN